MYWSLYILFIASVNLVADPDLQIRQKKKSEYLEKNLSEQRRGKNNKFNLHMAS